MSARHIRVGRPDDSTLDQLLTVAAASSLSYDHVRTSLPRADGSWPNRAEQVDLGVGVDVFLAAVEGLRSWVCHPGIGAAVYPHDAPIEVGSTLLVVLPAGPTTIVVPDRVVAVIDEPRRFGFAYGTLDGHQERGEESFVVEHLSDDRVVASIGLDAVPATAAARLASPFVGLFQRVAVRRYLAALRDEVAQ